MTFWNRLIFLAAVVLCAVSLLLPALHWYSIPADTPGQWFAAATALALGICKLGFFPLAWHHANTARWIPAAALSLFGALFLAINVDATRDLLAQQGQTRATLNDASNTQHQLITTQLEDLNQQIKTVNGLLAADLANGYRERAYQQQNKLAGLNEQRTVLAAQLERASESAQQATGARFGIGLGGWATQSAESLIDGELITALAIHLGCVLAVLACTGWLPGATTSTAIQPPMATVNPTKPTRPKSQSSNQSPARLTEKQAQLARRICAGEFGNTPGMKAIINLGVISGGHKKVKPVFDHLLANGDLKPAGKGYQLTQTTID